MNYEEELYQRVVKSVNKMLEPIENIRFSLIVNMIQDSPSLRERLKKYLWGIQDK